MQQQADQIFLKACEIPEEQHPEFLAKACGDDAQLRELVDRLLSADAEVNQEGRIVGGPAGGWGEAVRQAAADANQEAQEIAAGAADRNLLYGIVALQMNFIGRDALIQAMNQWVLSKTTPIENILVSQGDMGEQTQGLLTALVDKHLEYHAGDAAKSLASLSSVEQLKKDLEPIDDIDLEKSLSILTATSPTAATIAWRDPPKTDNRSRFRVLQPYRQGGLGAVSIAMDQELNRRVALKEVRKEHAHNQGFRERLRIEAEITGRLEHPGIVPVYGLGSHGNGNPFYCMRFIKGDSLKEAISSYHEAKQSMSPTERNLQLRGLLRRFIDVCDAISYAHSRQVLHRDLKPGNIMLGKYGETLVVDWGLAKATGTAETQAEVSEQPIVPRSGSTAAPTVAGSTLGTPEFMSPEQAKGRIDELGPATDIYSLGASLYCLLTGRAPVSADSTQEVLRRVRNGEFPAPRDLNRNIPKPLEAICLKAMQLEQADRYKSADAMARDVERWLADEVVHVYREPTLSRVARTLRKNRTATASIAVGIVVALSGLVAVNTITWQKNRQIAAKNAKIEEQNSELTQINEALVHSQEKLSRSFGSFRTLTAAMISKAERDLSQQPGMDAVRDWLTRKSLEIYQDVQQNWPQEPITNSIDTRVWVSQLYRYTANLNRNRNELEEAFLSYEKSTSMLDNLLIEEPNNPLVRGIISETLRDYALTFARAGKTVQARQHMARALEFSSGMRDQYPEAPNSKRLHATNQVDSAGIEIEEGRLEAALASAMEAQELIAPIVDSPQAKDTDRVVLIFSLIWQAVCRLDSGETRVAAESIDTAVDLCRSIAEDDSLRGFRHLLARALLTKSSVLKADELTDEASQAVSEALQIWQELSHAHPTFWTYEYFRLKARIALAIIGKQEQDNDESIASVSQTIDHLQELVTSHPTDYQILSMLCEAQLAVVQLQTDAGLEEDAGEALAEVTELNEQMQGLFPESQAVEQLKETASELRDQLGALNN